MRWGWSALVALPLAVVSIALIAAPGEAKEEPPTALVFEHLDQHTKAIGAAELLEGAGFLVAPLSMRGSPKLAKADVIVLGSFVCEHPDYRAYMKQHAGNLAAYVERGGVIVQFTQADEKEEVPPFLSEGLGAVRGDDEFERHALVAPGHALLAGITLQELPKPKAEKESSEEEEPNDAKGEAKKDGPAEIRLGFVKRLKKPFTWEHWRWQKGFAVLATSGEEGANPALLEGAAGKGRVVLTSWFLDKVRSGGGKLRVDERGLALSKQFFANLATYVRDVRDGRAPDVVPTVAPAESGPEPGGPIAVAWRLAPSDIVVFERRKVTLTEGFQELGKPAVVTVHGHDLRQGRQYVPVSAKRGDLKTILAFRLPPPEQTSTDLDFRIPLMRTVDVRVRGHVESREYGKDAALVTATYAFASQGRGGPIHSHEIRKGKATIRTVFDRRENAVLSARAELEFTLRKLDAKRGEKPKVVTEQFDWKRKDLKRTRYRGFHDDVNAAIARGVEHLRSLQKEDGSFKPHAKKVFGSTALVVFTLVACEVPVDDPAVHKAIEYMLTKNPRHTYERSVALMAMDKAYTPESEIAAARRGELKGFTRDLPPDRRAWCRRLATGLESSSRNPGSWGYPTPTNMVIQADASNTQYAVLGLRAAVRLGLPVEERTWLGVMRYVQLVRERKVPKGQVKLQHEGEATRDKTGLSVPAIPVASAAGFKYTTSPGHVPAWSSMTCAGITSLLIARDELRRLGSPRASPKLDKLVDEMVHGGWAWLDANWGMDRHPNKWSGGPWYYYYLYSLERAGILARVRRVGGKDWYFEGAAQLLARQEKTGGWNELKKADTSETCFALLFLKRATAPVTHSR